MENLVPANGQPKQRALATARLASIDDIRLRSFTPGKFWIGRAADPQQTPVGYSDDRHICLVSGSRGGKGTSSIINNLAQWPGSIVVVDPKGENASVLAARRASGSQFCDGLEQKTYVLDPFKASNVDEQYRACFNPLDSLDPDSEETVDEAGRLADAIVVSQGKGEPFFDEQARALIKALILHVLTSEAFAGRRNLVTVRQLVQSGDTATRAVLQEMGEADIPSAFDLLFEGMRRNPHFSGIVRGAGDAFGTLATSSERTFANILSTASNHTEFIDSTPMQRSLSSTTPGFSLARLKTDPMGVSLFLSLPQRFMNTHFRWLRMIVSLVITEMEKTPGQPASGHPVLLALDEFAGLKKLEVIENAAAQIAGFGVKIFFIVQSLAQLKSVYGEGWEVFLANAGLKLFFSVEDGFTREYVSRFIGETEVIRETESESNTLGTSTGRSQSHSDSYSSGQNSSFGFNGGSSTSSSIGALWNTAQSTTSSSGFSSSSGSSSSASNSSSYGTSTSESESRTRGISQTIHKRALLTPDEIGILFSRIDDKNHIAYPGLALALIPGSHPTIVRRTNYFEDTSFVRSFDPHPDHEFKKIASHEPVKSLRSVPDAGAVLISTYGEDNTRRAYAIVRKIFTDYPSIERARPGGADSMARILLEGADKSAREATADGRPHTVPEVLSVMEIKAGPYFAQNPSVNNIFINFGDVALGKAAKKAAKERKAELLSYLFGAALILMYAISAYLKR